jgi:hypothetical protein
MVSRKPWDHERMNVIDWLLDSDRCDPYLGVGDYLTRARDGS